MSKKIVTLFAIISILFIASLANATINTKIKQNIEMPSSKPTVTIPLPPFFLVCVAGRLQEDEFIVEETEKGTKLTISFPEGDYSGSNFYFKAFDFPHFRFENKHDYSQIYTITMKYVRYSSFEEEGNFYRLEYHGIIGFDHSYTITKIQ